tara:strand:- start:85 stop:306 length:222 start_codon:yes stop_codon:yes gene_type:complete
LLYRTKKPNYTEPLLGWNDEDRKTGIIKYGVTHYEPVTSNIRKIPCPIRPPVDFVEDIEPGPLLLSLDHNSEC